MHSLQYSRSAVKRSLRARQHLIAIDVQVEELARMSAATPVIAMGSDVFMKYAAGNYRPYSLFVFCDAAAIPEAKSLKLHQYVKNMAVVSKHVAAHARKQGPDDPASKIFFVQIDMAHSRDIFMALGVQNLPWALHIAPDTRWYALTSN